MRNILLVLFLFLVGCVASSDSLSPAPSTEEISGPIASPNLPGKHSPNPCTMTETLNGPNGSEIQIPIPCNEYWIDKGDPPDEMTVVPPEKVDPEIDPMHVEAEEIGAEK